jgi:hypothetical protein
MLRNDVHYLVFRSQNQAGNFRNVGNTRFRSADNMFPDFTNFGIPNVLSLICDEQRKNYLGLTLQYANLCVQDMTPRPSTHCDL